MSGRILKNYFGLLYGGVYGHENILWPLNSTTYSGRQGLFKIKECRLDHPNELFIKTNQKDTSKSGHSLNAFAIVEESFSNKNIENPCYLSHVSQIINAEINHATTMISIKIVNKANSSFDLWKTSATPVENHYSSNSLSQNINDFGNDSIAPILSHNANHINVDIDQFYFDNLLRFYIKTIVEIDNDKDKICELFKKETNVYSRSDIESIRWRLQKSGNSSSIWFSPQVSFIEDSFYFYIWNITYQSYASIINNKWDTDIQVKTDIINFVSLCINGYSFRNLSLGVFCFNLNEPEEKSIPSCQIRVQSSKIILFPMIRLYTGFKMNQAEKHFSLILCLPEECKVFCIEFIKRKGVDDILYEQSAFRDFLGLEFFRFRKEFEILNIDNWEMHTITNQLVGEQIEQNTFCQGFLSLLWIGHHLTKMKVESIVQTLTNKSTREAFIKQMFDFIKTFDEHAANSLILSFMINQSLTE